MRTLTRNHVVDSVDYVKSKKKSAQPFVSVSALSEPVPSVWCFMATMPHFREARHLAQDCNGREIRSGPPQWSSSNLTGCIHWAIKASQFFRGFNFLDFKWFQSIYWFINQSSGCLRGDFKPQNKTHGLHFHYVDRRGYNYKCSIFPLNHVLTAKIFPFYDMLRLDAL